MYVQQTSTFNQVNPTIVPANIQQQNQFSSVVTDITNLVLAVDGNLTLNDNFAGVLVSGTVGTSPTAISHTLGSIPIGFINIKPTSSAVIYASGTAWTANTIYLAAGTNTVANLFLIAGG